MHNLGTAILARVRYLVNDPSCNVGHKLQPGIGSSTDRAGGELCPAVRASHVTTGTAEHWHCPDGTQAYWAGHQGLQVLD